MKQSSVTTRSIDPEDVQMWSTRASETRISFETIVAITHQLKRRFVFRRVDGLQPCNLVFVSHAKMNRSRTDVCDLDWAWMIETKYEFAKNLTVPDLLNSAGAIRLTTDGGIE